MTFYAGRLVVVETLTLPPVTTHGRAGRVVFTDGLRTEYTPPT
jgi:hypothetical protein